jgi:hypothetical protein
MPLTEEGGDGDGEDGRACDTDGRDYRQEPGRQWRPICHAYQPRLMMAPVLALITAAMIRIAVTRNGVNRIFQRNM